MTNNIESSPLGKSMFMFEQERNPLSFSAKQLFDPDSLLFPEPSFANGYSADEVASLKIAQLSMLSAHSYSIWMDLTEVFKICESPIERHLLAAIIVTARSSFSDVTIHGQKTRYLDRPETSFRCLHIYPQKQIGDYRTDFLLTVIREQTAQSSTTKAPGVPQCIEYNLVVECDGHDFHEKTKEQASRDKERDRILQTCGYPVFRFSGSDIYKNSMKCAYDCFMYLDNKVAEELDT